MRIHITPMLQVIALLLSTAQSSVEAATIYRWTDDQGKTHYSEIVPEKYQKTAKALSPDTSSPTAEQQREAQERLAREKIRAAETERTSSKPGSQPVPASSTPITRRPTQVPDERTDCETWARLYKESLDCFGPYRTARGATREEAFTHCTPVDEPPTRCRQRLPD
jgi:hypothetical protein